MAKSAHEEDSTQSDSSTVVSDMGDINPLPQESPRTSLKRSADLLSSPSPAKQTKHQHEPESDPAISQSTLNALDFLRSRPQVAAMNAAREGLEPTASKTLQPAVSGRTQDTALAQPPLEVSQITELTAVDPDSSSWRHGSETVLEFLRRVPVADPTTARVGPWLWVRRPRELQEERQPKDLDTFIDTGKSLLGSLLEQRAVVEQQNPDKAVGTITRKMGPYRDQLQVDLLNAAVKYRVTNGKWMLFPKLDDLPRIWRKIAEATAEGKLGPGSKVGTWEPDIVTKGSLVCVYTNDFSDLTDVKRVLCALHDLDIVNKDVTIHYKCDAYTYLHVFSENQYKLRASLYSSEEVRNDKVKYEDGSIVRLNTKN